MELDTSAAVSIIKESTLNDLQKSTHSMLQCIHQYFSTVRAAIEVEPVNNDGPLFCVLSLQQID